MIRVIVVAVFLTSCGGSVKPWQRETLSHPCMVDESRAEELRARLHMLVAREASQGAAGAAGGGCGCR